MTSRLSAELWLPGETRQVDFVMEGTRTAGTDNDSYLDDLELRLAIDPPAGDDDDSATDDDDSGDDDSAATDDDDLLDDDDSGEPGPVGCADCAGQVGAGAPVEGPLLLLLLWAAIRRGRA